MVEAVAVRNGAPLNVVDIGSSDELVAEFALRVPVIRDPFGAILAEGEIDPTALRKAVRAARRHFRRQP